MATTPTASGMTAAQLRAELLAILVKASTRGVGGTLTADEAVQVLDAITASDQAPEWESVRVESRHILCRVIIVYRALESGTTTSPGADQARNQYR